MVATRLLDVPQHAEMYGFRTRTFGTILGRSVMLADFRRLMAACPSSATLSDYTAATVEENVLGKPTASARRLGFRSLREFYALDPELLLFRALRDLWGASLSAQPLLALLCATARDPILRAITAFVLDLAPGALVRPAVVSEEAERRFPGKFSSTVLRFLGKNVASSWAQAGLLKGRNKKERTRPDIQPEPVAYALLLGDLCGYRGRALFETFWARMLDAPSQILREQAVTASRHGWIEYRSSGDVIEVSFRHLMREEREGGQ